jgi:hypothetical protein
VNGINKKSIIKKILKNEIIFITLIYFIISIYFVIGTLISKGNVPPNDWGTPVTRSAAYALLKSSFYVLSNSDYGIITPSIILSIIINPLYCIFYGGNAVKFWSLFLLTLIGSNTYYLSRKIGLNKTSSFFAGLFYMSTPITFNLLMFGWIYYLLEYSFLPIYILLFMKTLNEKKIRYSFLSGLILAIIAQPLFVLIYIVVTIVFLAFNLKKNSFILFLKNTLIVFAIYAIENLSVIQNSLFMHNLASFFSSKAYASAEIAQFSNLGSFLNVIRLWGSNWNLWFETYYPAKFILLTFIPILFIGLASLVSKNKISAFFSLLYLIFVGITFVAYKFLYFIITEIPLGYIFDEFNMLLFPAALGMAISIGFFMHSFSYKIKGDKEKIKKLAFSAVIFIIIVFSGLSWWTGQAYGPSVGYADKLNLYSVPSDIQNWSSKVNASDEYFVLYDPIIFDAAIANSSTFRFGLNSNLYAMNNLNHVDPYEPYTLQIYNLISENKPGLAYELGNLSIKYVVVYKIAEPPFTSGKYIVPDEIISNLSNQRGFVKVIDTPDLAVFENNYAVPIVHSNNASVKIMYMDPTEFVVLAKSDSSFVIILNQQYSDLWTASVNGKPVPLYDHIRVNTQINGLYFNGWLINSTGTSKIILYYKPQTQNLILLTFSVTFDLAILIGYIYLFLKERIKK